MSLGPTIQERLEAWLAEVWNGTLEDPDFQSLYQYSEEWNRIWDAAWAKYDTLESERARVKGAARASWQDDAEEHRRDHEADRKDSSIPNMDVIGPLIPLSIHLDQFEGTKSQDRILPWGAAVRNWARFHDLAQSPSSGLMGSLSGAQKSAYQVLAEWWTSTYSDSRLLNTAKEHMTSLAMVVDLSDPRPHEDDDERIHAIAAGTEASLYHSHCFDLFLFEFHPYCWEPCLADWLLDDLQSLRQDTVAQAICQRMAFSFVSSAPRVGLEADLFYPEPPRESARYSDGIRPPREKPYYLWDTRLRCTVKLHEIQECDTLKYTCISHTWGRWRKEPWQWATLPGVPWSVPEITRYDVSQLPDELGRLGARYIWFDLFCIPQAGDQTRMDIEISIQAEIFRGAHRCIAWMNHCQTFQGLNAAVEWLALKYLKTTSRPLDGQSTFDTLDGRLDSLRTWAKQAMELMQLPSDTHPRHGNRPASPRASSKKEVSEPAAWFSSLWTLQEAALCPNLQLRSQDWTTLSDGSRQPITLTTLFLFIQETAWAVWAEGPVDKISFNDPRNYRIQVATMHASTSANQPKAIRKALPKGVAALQQLRTRTNLHQVLETLNPMAILTNSNLRQYTGDRAPGIMSAIGVTDWYHRRHLDAEGQKLVLNVYPLAFVREAAMKLGAIFYSGLTENSRFAANRSTAISGTVDDYVGSGTMLPFSDITGFDAFVDFFSNDLNVGLVTDHSSVKGWKIDADGSVRLTSAGIMASSSDAKSDKPGRFVVHWIDTTGSTKESESSDLFGDHRWIANKHEESGADLPTLLCSIAAATGPGRIIYAVALFTDISNIRGILLSRWVNEVPGKIGFLIKIGTFVQMRAEGPRQKMPPSTTFDCKEWCIL